MKVNVSETMKPLVDAMDAASLEILVFTKILIEQEIQKRFEENVRVKNG